MRRGEVANMKPEHLDLENQRLLIPKTKTKSPRPARLHDELVDAILRYQRVVPTRAVMWPSASNRYLGAITAPGIGQMIKRREKAAGIKLGTHAWRRRMAGEWIARGGTETGLMAAAGWSSTAMVARYSKGVAQENAMAESERLFG
jgi:integrase